MKSLGLRNDCNEIEFLSFGILLGILVGYFISLNLEGIDPMANQYIAQCDFDH